MCQSCGQIEYGSKADGDGDFKDKMFRLDQYSDKLLSEYSNSMERLCYLRGCDSFFILICENLCYVSTNYYLAQFQSVFLCSPECDQRLYSSRLIKFFFRPHG